MGSDTYVMVETEFAVWLGVGGETGSGGRSGRLVFKTKRRGSGAATDGGGESQFGIGIDDKTGQAGV